MKTNQQQKNIPSGWQQVKLADLGVFTKGSGITKDQLTDTGYNAVRYGEIYTKYNFKIDKIYSHIPAEVLSSTVKIKYGDVLFAGSGETNEEIGKSASYLLYEDCYAGGDLIIFRPKNANSMFISYFLNIGEGRKKLSELGQGQSVVHIYKSEIEKLSLHLPTLPEQNRIVSVLETWDKSIKNLNKKIELKKEIKKGLMQDLLTGKKRLSGFKKDWQTSKLKNFITGVSTRNKKLQVNRVLSISNKYGFVLPESQFARVVASEDLSNYKVISRGDFAYNPSRINVGSIARLNDFDGGILSPMYIAFRPNKNVSADYLYQWIFMPETNGKIRSCASGSVRESVDFKSFCSIKIRIPDFEEQVEISKILSIADKEITELEKKLSIIKEQKKFLLNNLITGVIRTPDNLRIN